MKGSGAQSLKSMKEENENISEEDLGEERKAEM